MSISEQKCSVDKLGDMAGEKNATLRDDCHTALTNRFTSALI